MGLGVVQDRRMGHVPGTSQLYDKAMKEPIRKVPQPSNDPNDPLNWPLVKRDAILAILAFTAVISTTLSPILAANSLTLSLQFGRNFTDIALLTGYHLCGVGVAGILFVPSARVWGKRHIYLIGVVLMIVSSAWGGASKSYGSLLGARVLQGFAVAPFEALINVTVSDMYFVHERGKRLALTNLAAFGGSFFTPVLVGKMTNTIGWPWTFYFVAIFGGCCLPLVFFFVPETGFPRTSFSTEEAISTENLKLDSHVENGHEESKEGDKDQGSSVEIGDGQIASPKNSTPRRPEHIIRGEPATFKQRLMPFNGRKTHESYFKLLLRPFPLFAQPAILWGALIQGCMIGWTVFIGVVLAAIFLSPPLFFNEIQTGYMYSGPFVGALLGFVVAGLLADWSAKQMTKWNGGIYEPEFRIILVIPQLVIGCAGLYGFGITASDAAKYNWFPPEFFFSCQVMGMVIGAVASSVYLTDAYNEIAIEAFTCLLIFKNMFSFGLTWSAYNWILLNGIKTTFMAVSSVQVGICLLSIPMYIFGKKNRSFFSRHDIFKLTHLK